jgi:predicted nucleic acid-binding protein
VTNAAIADTSVFVARESGRALAVAALPDVLAVSIITIGELRAGVLAASDVGVRDQRLSTLEAAMEMTPLPVDDAVASAWARLRVELRNLGKRMPLNDSWIAATALAHHLAITTQDEDYDDVPGLQVVKV